MKRPLAILITIVIGILKTWPASAADLSKGIESFEQRRWMAAMGEFIAVIKEDPRNTQAHEYLLLANEQLSAERRAAARARRLEILEDLARRFEDDHRDASVLHAAIAANQQAADDV